MWAIRNMTQISMEVHKVVVSLRKPYVMRINSVLLRWFYQLVAITSHGRNKSLAWKHSGPQAMEIWFGAKWERQSEKKGHQHFPRSFLTWDSETPGRPHPLNYALGLKNWDSKTFIPWADQRNVTAKAIYWGPSASNVPSTLEHWPGTPAQDEFMQLLPRYRGGQCALQVP